MIGEDARVGEFQRLDSPGVRGGDRRVDLGGGNANPLSRQVHAVEAQGIFRERRVAARAHVGNDRGDRIVDVDGRFALGVQQRDELGLKIGRVRVEKHRHG